jgi:hypothetical protein
MWWAYNVMNVKEVITILATQMDVSYATCSAHLWDAQGLALMIAMVVLILKIMECVLHTVQLTNTLMQ